MEFLEAMERRHSVRSFEDKKIEGSVKDELLQIIDECNKESGLHMQLVLDEPQAFAGFMAHYGKFSGVRNYIAIIGKKGENLEETCGYYGEKVVLYAQQLGLNTCWVAMTYSKVKGAFEIIEGEKLCCVIAIGYGKTQGVAHKSKSVENVSKVSGDIPDWFRKGIEAALLAPTAINQQKFQFVLDGNKVSAKPGIGFYSRVDLGIAKYHFEIGADVKNFIWS
jgi:nitroreductase